jgi:hypothetical protein
MITLRKFLTVAAVVLPVTPAGALAQQRLTFAHSAAPDIVVKVQGPFSSLRISGWALDSVSVTAQLPNVYRLDNPFAGDPKQPLRGAKIYIDGPEEVVTKGGFLELRVPEGATVWVKGGMSEVRADGVTGELDINLIGGAIIVNGKPRATNIESLDARVTFNGFAEWLRVKSAAGDIDVSGRVVDAGLVSTSGNIRVDALLERAELESMSGSLTFTGELARGASVALDSHGGPIDVQLGGKSDVSIEAVSVAGTIENLLTSQRPTTNRDGRGQRLEMDVGFGVGGRVTINTYKGTVRLAPQR